MITNLLQANFEKSTNKDFLLGGVIFWNNSSYLYGYIDIELLCSSFRHDDSIYIIPPVSLETYNLQTFLSNIIKSNVVTCGIYNTGGHWVAYGIFKSESTLKLVYKDSSGSTSCTLFDIVENIAIQSGKSFETLSFASKEQQDGTSCGIYAFENMKKIALGSLDFHTIQNIDLYRKKLASDILDQKTFELLNQYHRQLDLNLSHQCDGVIKKFFCDFLEEKPIKFLDKIFPFEENFENSFFFEDIKTIRSAMKYLVFCMIRSLGISEEDDESVVLQNINTLYSFMSEVESQSSDTIKLISEMVQEEWF